MSVETSSSMCQWKPPRQGVSGSLLVKVSVETSSSRCQWKPPRQGVSGSLLVKVSVEASSSRCQWKPLVKVSVQTPRQGVSGNSSSRCQWKPPRHSVKKILSSIQTHITAVSSDSRQSYPFRLTSKLSIQTHVTAVSSDSRHSHQFRLTSNSQFRLTSKL